MLPSTINQQNVHQQIVHLDKNSTNKAQQGNAKNYFCVTLNKWFGFCKNIHVTEGAKPCLNHINP